MSSSSSQSSNSNYVAAPERLHTYWQPGSWSSGHEHVHPILSRGTNQGDTFAWNGTIALYPRQSYARESDPRVRQPTWPSRSRSFSAYTPVGPVRNFSSLAGRAPRYQAGRLAAKEDRRSIDIERLDTLGRFATRSCLIATLSYFVSSFQLLDLPFRFTIQVENRSSDRLVRSDLSFVLLCSFVLSSFSLPLSFHFLFLPSRRLPANRRRIFEHCLSCTRERAESCSALTW